MSGGGASLLRRFFAAATAAATADWCRRRGGWYNECVDGPCWRRLKGCEQPGHCPNVCDCGRRAAIDETSEVARDLATDMKGRLK